MPNLSRVFSYISHFRHAGHQVGRKVGDMLEVLTYAGIAQDSNLLSRLHVEPKLYGFSDAGHKVEFAFLREASIRNGVPFPRHSSDIRGAEDLIGFIECKKVGVEQTVNGYFKRQFNAHANRGFKIPYGSEMKIVFRPRDLDISHRYTLQFVLVRQVPHILVSRVTNNGFQSILNEPIIDGHRVIFTLSSEGESVVLGNSRSLREIDSDLRNCKILDIESCADTFLTATLNDCLTGPQTPEKAKQSSFVALDIRKLRYGSFDKRANERQCPSILLTEYSHWEEKSKNMITACIDKVLVVDDDQIIEAFEAFEREFGADFYNWIRACRMNLSRSRSDLCSR